MGLNRWVSAAFVGLMGTVCVMAEERAATQPTAVWVPLPEAGLTVKSGPNGKALSIAAGAISGVAVDRTNGDVYAVLRNRKGVVKSEDQGEAFKDEAAVGGQTVMYSGSISVDPEGKRVAVFPIYGPGGMTVDGGKTWTAFKDDGEKLGKYFDFGTVAWSGEHGGKAILGAIHESKGRLVLSVDGGATWRELGTGFMEKGPIGILDEKTLLSTKGKFLSRSVDGGDTWSKVGEIPQGPRSPVITVFKGVCYVLTANGMMVSKDQGATWTVQGEAVKANIGPLIGKDEEHLAAIRAEGCYETKDGGKHWMLVAPARLVRVRVISRMGGIPGGDIFYFAQGGKPAMKCVVGK